MSDYCPLCNGSDFCGCYSCLCEEHLEQELEKMEVEYYQELDDMCNLKRDSELRANKHKVLKEK